MRFIRYFRFSGRFLSLSGFKPLFLGLPLLRSFLDLAIFSGELADRLFRAGYRKQKLESPIFILAYPRSGTTFLQRSLPEHFDKLQGNQLLEMIAPALSLRRALKPFRRRLDKLSEKLYDPKIHPTGLYSEETDDAAMFFRYFDGLFYWLNHTAWQKGMSDEQLEKSLIKACAKPKHIRHIKKIYQKKIYKEGGRVLSKSFSFIISYHELKKQFPGARFIFLLRDPMQAIPSCLSLVRHVQQGIHNFDKIADEKKEVFYRNIYRASKVFYRVYDELMKAGTGNEEGVACINYRELTEDYAGVMQRIVGQCGLQADNKTLEAIAQKAQKQKTYKSSHTYSPEEFGISSEEIRRDFATIYEKYL